MGVIELALAAVLKAETVEARMRSAQKAGQITGHGGDELAQAALKAGVINNEELALLKRTTELRNAVIRVDDFPPDFSHEQQQPLAQRAVA